MNETDLHESILLHLQEKARNRDTTCYGPIAELLGLDLRLACDRNRIGEVVGELSEQEHAQGRPMISAVVVKAETRMPGKGFFTLARKLGFAVGDETAFHVRELSRVHEHWANHD